MGFYNNIYVPDVIQRVALAANVSDMELEANQIEVTPTRAGFSITDFQCAVQEETTVKFTIVNRSAYSFAIPTTTAVLQGMSVPAYGLVTMLMFCTWSGSEWVQTYRVY